MNGLNVLTAEKQHGDEAKQKLNLGIDMAVQHRNLGVVLVEHGKEMKKTADILYVRGMVNLIVVRDMIALATMIEYE